MTMPPDPFESPGNEVPKEVHQKEPSQIIGIIAALVILAVVLGPVLIIWWKAALSY